MGRTIDPYMGRLMPWTCWRHGAEAIHVWSFGDTGGASSWNEYVAIRDTYAPLFISEDSVTAGKHLEAAREGVEDYEYFVMLDREIREAHAQGANGPEVEEARQLLQRLPARVCDAVDQQVFPNWLRENVDRTHQGVGRTRERDPKVAVMATLDREARPRREQKAP